MQVHMPQLGLHMTEGEVAKWLVEDGAFCDEGVPIIEVETDKLTHEISSPCSGYVHIIISEGTTVDVGVVIGVITANADRKSEAD
jgi:pyruvate/2-oxoglutarate dehydrogenase complex dihydrolipoamide acyltransferase (E2) component